LSHRTSPFRRNGDPGRAGTKARGSFSGTPTREDAERAAKAKGYLSKAKIDAFIEAFMAGARAQAKAAPIAKTLKSAVYSPPKSGRPVGNLRVGRFDRPQPFPRHKGEQGPDRHPRRPSDVTEALPRDAASAPARSILAIPPSSSREATYKKYADSAKAGTKNPVAAARLFGEYLGSDAVDHRGSPGSADEVLAWGTEAYFDIPPRYRPKLRSHFLRGFQHGVEDRMDDD